MSRIDDLIRQHCPAGIEMRPIGEIGVLERGNGIQKSDFVDVGVGCIHYGQIHTHYGTWATETKSFVSPELAAKTRRAESGDLVIATTSEDDEAVGKAMAWLGSDSVAVSTDAFILRHSMDPKFVAYFFQTEQFQAQKRRHVTGTKVRRISGEALAKINIPVPPLGVQREIVRVLDLFQALEAELEAELEARRRQYAHYRDSLLDFTERGGVRWMTLGEVFEMKAGQFVLATDISREPICGKEVPCFGGNGLRGFVDRQTHDGVHLLIGRQGALCGNVHRHRGALYATEHAVVVVPRVEVDLDWAFHLLTSMKLNQYATKSAQPGLSVGRVAQLRIPLPEIDEQRRTARALDTFDVMTSDLAIGLPAELTARRSQYEFYRDRLLTFRAAA